MSAARKIIQFQRDSQPPSESWNGWDRLTVLYDDGTIWTYEYSPELKKCVWVELPSYPDTTLPTRGTE